MRLRHAILATILATSLSLPAFAQVKMNVAGATDPSTGLSSSEWEQAVGNMLNVDALKGIEGVIIVSSMPVPLTVTCDKWELVGSEVYKSVAQNPREIKPFSVTFIKTNEFDGYCRDGVIGHYGLNKTVVGKLTSRDGSFKNATIVLFSGAR